MTRKHAVIHALTEALVAARDERARLAEHTRAFAARDGSSCPQTFEEDLARQQAEGMARRIEAEVARLDRERVALGELGPGGPEVGAGSLVTLGDGRRVLVAPGGAGQLIDGVRVVSPTSPLGCALRGLEAGDEVELPTGEVVIDAVE